MPWQPVLAFLGIAAVIFVLSEPKTGDGRLAGAAIASDATREISGPASVIDGDTLAIGGRRIRLFGIDAPEADQSCKIDGRNARCGWRSTRELTDKIAGRPVTCQQKSVDQYNRIVAVCSVGGEDLNGWMVESGLALAYRHFADDYLMHEAEASAAERGIWKSRFVAPWDWRQGTRL